MPMLTPARNQPATQPTFRLHFRRLVALVAVASALPRTMARLQVGRAAAAKRATRPSVAHAAHLAVAAYSGAAPPAGSAHVVWVLDTIERLHDSNATYVESACLMQRSVAPTAQHRQQTWADIDSTLAALRTV